MNRRIIYYLLEVAVMAYLAFTLYGCANKSSGPQGGPKDETPPQVKKETPLNGELNYKAKKVEVEFDEIIVLESVMENVLISPPQQKQPLINAYGKKLKVEFEDELRDSTTYTISFGEAIVDNNEKNALKGYSFSFATGPELDTLEISGTLINAADLNPMSGKTVGIYREMHDSVFSLKPFMRIARTDENGEFTIKNIRKGTYKIYALADMNRDYIRQVGEGLATYDSIVTPYVRIEEVNDTVWADSITVDSVRTYMDAKYYPNDILMRYYEENRCRQYFVKSDRPHPHVFSLYFAMEADTLPVLTPLTDGWDESQVLIQKNATNDTITYWLRDTLVSATDTLRFAMDYLKTDSLYQLFSQRDTITVVYRHPQVSKRGGKGKKEGKDKKQATEFIELKNNASGTFEIYNPIILTLSTPIERVDTALIHLTEQVDTLMVPIEYIFEALDSVGMTFAITHDWEAEKAYEISIDSAALHDIYGLHNDASTSKFTIRSLDEYSKLIVKLDNHDPRAIIEILDTKDVPVRSLPASESGAVFEHLTPTDYYMRLFIDENGDGKWTTGDFAKKRAPESVYYFPSKLTLRANWDFEENWDHLDTPLLEQKPAELRKNDSSKK